MLSLKEAIEQWQNQIDDYKDNCCNYSHFVMDDIGNLIPKPDSEVCKREQAWRVYVRIRDSNPAFPFGKRFYL